MILGGRPCQSLTQGVGKNNFTMNETRYKNASLKETSRGLATMLEKGRRKVSFITQSKDDPFRCCVTKSGQHNP
jgi:hypothetical protein